MKNLSEQEQDQARLKALIEIRDDEKMRPAYRKIAKERAEKLQAKMFSSGSTDFSPDPQSLVTRNLTSSK